MAEYILFDLDGTLTDPKEGITKCVQYALRHFGIDEPELDRLEPFIGPPLASSFQDFYEFDETKSMEAVEKYRERYRDIGIFENRCYDGICQMLSVLKEAGKVLAVASSKPEVFCVRIAEKYGMKQYLTEITGSELDGSRTVKAEVIEEALRRLAVSGQDHVIMVGDRSHDVIGAKCAGIPCIGVTFGYGGREELEQAGADVIVDTVGELTRCLLQE